MIFLENDITPILNAIKNESRLGLDVESSDLDYNIATLLLIQIATSTETFILNVGKIDKKEIQYLLHLISAKNIEVVGHNIKFDLKMLYHNFGVMPHHVFDTQLAYSFAFAGIGSNKYKSLDFLCRKYLNFGLPKDVRLSFVGKTDFEFTEEQLQYADLDARVLLPLHEIMISVLKDQKQFEIFDRIEMPLLPPIVMMEYTGVSFDLERWIELAKIAEEESIKIRNDISLMIAGEFDKIGRGHNALEVATLLGIATKSTQKKRKAELEAITTWEEIRSEIVQCINWGSHVHVKRVLNLLGVDVVTTNAHELLLHKNEHPIVGLILSVRGENKKKSSFGLEFLSNVNNITKCIHTTYNQDGAGTGRFSSDNPNLQNIVTDSRYRNAFKSRPDYSFVRMDYSQIELRIIGEASKEPKFIEAFKNKQDLHLATASAIFELPQDEITSAQRSIAKSLNFAVIYGTTARGLAFNFGIPEADAKIYLKRYFDSYPFLKKFILDFGAQCIKRGFSTTMGKRKRYLVFPIKTTEREHFRIMSKVHRQAVNHLPQGTSADMIKKALINLYYNNPFGYDKLRSILTVHDEIVIEIHDSILEEGVEFCKKCMIDAGEEFLKIIPVECSTTIGKQWMK